MKMNFRLFDSSDTQEVKEMMFSLYSEDPEGESISDDKILKTFMHLQKYPEQGQIVVFDITGITVGYAILIYYWSNEFGSNLINIDELYVKSEWRNKGIASAFFDHLFDHYKGKVSGYQLEVTPSNKKAMRYYQRLGFTKKINSHLIRLSKES